MKLAKGKEACNVRVSEEQPELVRAPSRVVEDASRDEYGKEGRLAEEAEEMYHTKVYMVPFSVHGGGTSLTVDILSEFIVDIRREDENKFERHIETEKAIIP